MRRREYERKLEQWEAEGYKVSGLREKFEKWRAAQETRVGSKRYKWASIAAVALILVVAVVVWQGWLKAAPELEPATTPTTPTVPVAPTTPGCRLTTSVSPSGGGSVSPDGGTYKNGDTITLTALSSSGYEFDHWGGHASGNENPVTITMNSDKHVIAFFKKSEPTLPEPALPPPVTVPEYTLTTAVSPAGGGSISPDSGSYTKNSSVTLAATPSVGYYFVSWSGNAFGTSTTVTITMDSDKNVVANFLEKPPQPITRYTLTTSVSPMGGGTISPGSGTYDENTVVTLQATPSSGYQFDHWSGDASGTGAMIKVIMDSNKSIVGNFYKQVLTVYFDGWYVNGVKINTAIKGQTVTAKVTLSGGNEGQYEMRIRRDMVWVLDETVASDYFSYDGIWVTIELTFVPLYVTSFGGTNGCHVDLQKDGYTIWTLDSSYPPRLRVNTE